MLKIIVLLLVSTTTVYSLPAVLKPNVNFEGHHEYVDPYKYPQFSPRNNYSPEVEPEVKPQDVADVDSQMEVFGRHSAEVESEDVYHQKPVDPHQGTIYYQQKGQGHLYQEVMPRQHANERSGFPYSAQSLPAPKTADQKSFVRPGVESHQPQYPVHHTTTGAGQYHAEPKTLIYAKQQQPSVHHVQPKTLIYAKQQQPSVHNPVGTKSVDHGVGVMSVMPKQFREEKSVASARIVQQETDVYPDGSFSNVWNSDNGINVQEHGEVKHAGETDVAVVNGQYSYVDNEGHQFQVRYLADETGFHVQGDHLPTPPPIPAAIARGLEYIANHPPAETTTHNYQQEQKEYYQHHDVSNN